MEFLIMKKKLIMKSFYFVVFVLLSTHAFAFTDGIPEGLKVQAQYVEDKGNVIGVVELDIAKDYYAYAPDNASGVGLPTQLVVKNSAGEILPAYFPAGVERIDYYEKDKKILAFTDKIYLFVELGDVDAKNLADAKFTAELSMLLCSTEHCLPVRAQVSFSGAQMSSSLTEKQNLIDLFQKAKQLGNVNAALMEEDISSAMQQEKGGASKLQERFNSSVSANGFSTDKAPAQESIEKQSANEIQWNFSPQPFAENLEVAGLGKALLFGLLAGFILNLMPCVLPVLTLKMHSLLRAEDGEQRMQAFRTHNLFFAAGIVFQFFILALILGSAQLMWGELFQNVYFVASMLVIVFALSLSLLGVFTLPMLDLKASTTSSPRRQAFMTGIVATLLATPCSGPLLGGVLSFALLQPIYIVVLVVTAVGLGMSAPYLFFAWRPQCVRFLPKPGAWMELLEKLVAFFLLGTAIYIFSILPSYAHISILTTLLVVTLCAWLYGHYGGLAAPAWRRKMFATLFFVSMFTAVFYGVKEPQEQEVQWQEFSVHEFTANLGKKAMVVEFTADWCPNCKFVEKTVLTSENLLKWHKEYDVSFIRVDFTRDNAHGEALLHALGSKSIPFTAIFGKGSNANRPIVLRDIFSTTDMETALEQAK